MPISKSIIFIPLLLITVFTLTGFGLVDLFFNRTAVQRCEEDLIRLAYSGARLIDILDEKSTLADFDNFADIFAGDNRFRVTIIDLAGVVLGDSRLSVPDVRQIENMADRPEILESRDSGIGISRRYSTTLKIDLLFVAVGYNSRGRQGYLRIALPLLDLKKEQARQRMILGGFCFIALLVAAILSLLASRFILSLVEKTKNNLAAKVQKRTRQIEILQNFGTQLTACNLREEALEVIGLVTATLLPRFSGALALTRASRDRIEIVKSWNGPWQGESDYSPDQCWSLRTGKPHIGNPDKGNIACGHTPNLEGKLCCIPLVAQGETLGVLHFSSPANTEWTSAENQLATAVAEHCSLTLANLQMRESLQQQAIHDPLTGLYNRRYLFETMGRELGRAMRKNNHLGVLMIDLDHFKKFNDEHGHDIGDFILSEFGRLVRIIIRNEDIACRFGGEEFTIVLPETDREGTAKVAEKIMADICGHDFIVENRSYGPITISVGAAVFPDNGETVELLLKQADDALYQAKRAGRKRIVFADIPQ